jgi:hypothetical protein
LAPVAVAAVGRCHGLEALRVHPAIQTLRQQDPRQSDLPQALEAVGPGGTIVRLPTRRPLP